MARYYVPLPAFRAPPPLDFSGLNEGLDALGKSVEKNRLLAEQKELGEALRSGGQPSAATSSAAPQYGAQPNRLLASPAQGSFAAAGREYGGMNPMDGYKRSIAGIESAHEANPYQARGPVVQSGDRAFGKYQVMGANVGPWTKEILGREMSPEEFLASPEAQEKVFEGKFGQYASKHGPEGAASMWFTGRPSAPNARARGADGNPIGITGREYVSRFSGGTGQPEVSPPRPQAAPGPNFSGAADVAFRQGRVDTGLSLLEAQRERENQAYNRTRQERTDAQTSEVNEITLQEKRQELETATQRKLAGIAQTIGGQTDPAARAAMWNKFVGVNPRIATTLQQYGIDPRDAEAGSAFLIAEARGLTDPKPSEFKTFKQDEGIMRTGPSGVQVLREPGNKPDDKLQNSKFEQDLRKEYTALSKDFREVSGGLSRVEAASQLGTGAGDVALIYGFMKINDPGSVVRETEFDIANGIGSLPERWQGYVQKMLTGQGLPDGVRKEITATAQALAQRKLQEQQAIDSRFAQISRENGVDPNRVLLPLGSQPQPQQNPPPGRVQLGPRPEGVTDEQIMQEANQALRDGKDPAAVRQQLEAWGIRF